jgi:Spy/CpxP family protein refolding chaperone
MGKTAIGTLLFTLACATTLLSAQTQTTHTPPSPATIAQHRVSYLTTVLSLTSEQQQQATTIFTNAATTASGLHTQIKTARQNLATAVQSDDTGTINQISTTIGNLLAQEISNQANANAAFYKTLTSDQQSKLTQLKSERHGMGFMGRRGGW